MCCSWRILVAAGKAAPTPPVGPALGARGVKPMNFCKDFNARTAGIEPGVPTPTLTTVRPDRSFTFIIKTPPTTYFLKKAAGVEKGTGKPGHDTVGTVCLKHVYEIAKIKSKDEHMNHLSLEDIARMVVGSARSLGTQSRSPIPVEYSSESEIRIKGTPETHLKALPPSPNNIPNFLRANHDMYNGQLPETKVLIKFMDKD
ncbi:60s ribosomal protein l19 [Moniliophthora roreri MCA 2997]|nr:60s ribosomal protein l19 [Moniliophthora roreri MCA 2997]